MSDCGTVGGGQFKHDIDLARIVGILELSVQREVDLQLAVERHFDLWLPNRCDVELWLLAVVDSVRPIETTVAQLDR